MTFLYALKRITNLLQCNYFEGHFYHSTRLDISNAEINDNSAFSTRMHEGNYTL